MSMMKTGTGVLTLNSVLDKPTPERLAAYRRENTRAMNSQSIRMMSRMMDLTQIFQARRNTSMAQIVDFRTTVDRVSGVKIPVPDCHVWYEIDGAIDDFTPYYVDVAPGVRLKCTEYVPYNESLQRAMKQYFLVQWQRLEPVLMKYPEVYLTRQNMCWMRCGVLHKLNREIYSLKNLRIGSLGFKYKGSIYWEFG
jgi:hypothetical protein